MSLGDKDVGSGPDRLRAKAERLVGIAWMNAGQMLPTFYSEYATEALRRAIDKGMDDRAAHPDWRFFVTVASVYVAMMVLGNMHPTRIADLGEVPFRTDPQGLSDSDARRWLAEGEDAFHHCHSYVDGATTRPMEGAELMRAQAVALGMWVLGNVTGQLPSDYEDGKAAQLLGIQITQLSSYWL